MFLRIVGARSAEQFGIRGVKSFDPNIFVSKNVTVKVMNRYVKIIKGVFL